MLEKIKYINNQNEVVQFGKEIYTSENDLRNYQWDYDDDFNQITNLKRGITDKSLSLFIYARTKEQGIKLRNEIFEIFEKDVLMNKKGKFVIGDYYYKCFIVGGYSNDFLYSEKFLRKEISIVTDEPYWIKETNNIFRPSEEGQNNRSFYDYDYPYGYSNNLGIRDITNNHFIDSDIKIIMYGPVTNPTVYIKGHQYKVNTELLAGEYLTIDTKDKTIIKTKNNGETVNEFHKRDKVYNIFKKISPGSSFVSWDETFTFEIIVIEERSEPKWI